MLTVDELKSKFGVVEDQNLAEKFGRSPSAVALWRKNGVPASIERKAMKMLGLPMLEGQDPITEAIIEDVLKMSKAEKAELYHLMQQKFADNQRRSS